MSRPSGCRSLPVLGNPSSAEAVFWAVYGSLSFVPIHLLDCCGFASSAERTISQHYASEGLTMVNNSSLMSFTARMRGHGNAPQTPRALRYAARYDCNGSLDSPTWKSSSGDAVAHSCKMLSSCAVYNSTSADSHSRIRFRDSPTPKLQLLCYLSSTHGAESSRQDRAAANQTKGLKLHPAQVNPSERDKRRRSHGLLKGRQTDTCGRAMDLFRLLHIRHWLKIYGAILKIC